MQTSAVALNSITPDEELNVPIADDRVYPEQFLARLIGIHIQPLRVARRRDAGEGTVGRRTPIPTWVSDRRVGYRGKHIRKWLDRRAASADQSAA